MNASKKPLLDRIRQALSHIDLSVRNIVLWLAASLVLTVITTLGSQVVFTGHLWSSPQENYIAPLSVDVIVNFSAAFITTNLLMALVFAINRIYRFVVPSISERQGERLPDHLFFFACFVVLLLAWFPYFLTYLPGGVYSDTWLNWAQAQDMDSAGLLALNNHHPILYTLAWRAVILLGRLFHADDFGTITIFTGVQCVFMAAVLAYLVVWLRRHDFNRYLVYYVLALLALFPLFPLYAVSLWKDTPYSLFLLLFTLCLGDWALSRDNRLLRSTPYLIRLFVLSLLVCFLRNNGKYIVFAALLVVLLMNVKSLRLLKKFLAGALGVLALVQGIQGPVYNAMGYNVDSTVESLGIPIQQMAYYVYHDYDLTEEEYAYITEICPAQSIKEYYNPCIFDSLKWNAPGFDISVVEADKGRFLRHYLSLVLKHPLGAIKAYMLATAGFWAPNVTSSTGYIQNFVWDNAYGIETYDAMAGILGFSVSGFVTHFEWHPISSAVFLFITLYAALVLLFNREYKKLLLLVPSLLNWATIMLATPVACSLRYVYILVLMVPVEVYLICTSAPAGKAAK